MRDHVDQLDAAVARDRAALVASVSALRDRLSPDALLSGGIGILQDRAMPALKSAGAMARANPAAVAVTVAGVAWLLLGNRQRKAPGPADDPALAGTRFEALSRWEDEGGPVRPEAPVADIDVTASDDWMDDAIRADADGLSAADRAAGLARSFRKGLEGLSVAAQDRVAAAREAVFRARGDATTAVASPEAAPRQDRTLVVGVLGLLAGALAGALLPVSATERRALAATRAALLDEARRVLDEERERAADIAANLADGLRDDLDFATARLADAADDLVRPPT